MADIRIRRAHSLGLAKARKVADRWAQEAEARLSVACTTHAGEDEDVIDFSRPGVDGRLVVRADAFDVTVQLGFLLGAFKPKIETAIEEHLDALLAETPSKATTTGTKATKAAKTKTKPTKAARKA